MYGSGVGTGVYGIGGSGLAIGAIGVGSLWLAIVVGMLLVLMGMTLMRNTRRRAAHQRP